ncbi:DEAD/DEAH box helicase [Heyndrickxia coagulans]|uniref:DEAD/DEAH box helicase n=1 Tax=Heyndrickxia coagulans TaxID=1398 RepID=UPI002235D31C|nr:DEAD/DEAH box helicase [Heyndrickxia coagulans]UZH05864.1 DEAD/DEAH box helicase [Heyndrickxia coagulans]
MVELLLFEEDVEDMYSPAIFRRGMRYYLEGRVKKLIPDSTMEFTWTAIVKGSKTYYVTVRYDEEFGGFANECTCPAFAQYGECKHEVAAMLAIANREEEVAEPDIGDVPEMHQNMKTLQLMNIFSGLQQSMMETKHHAARKPLRLEYFLKATNISGFGSDHFLTIEFKIGPGRTYVVRNIKEFLGHVSHGNPHEFTKNFTYDPDEYEFEKEDHEIVEMLLFMLSTQQLYEASIDNWYRYTFERELVIPPFIARPLIEKLANRKCKFEYGRYASDSITVQPGEELPLSFRLDGNRQGGPGFSLQLKSLRDLLLFEQYGLAFYKGVFYETPDEQLVLLKALEDFYKNSGDEVEIRQEQMSPFLSNVLPGLKRIGKVKLTNEIKGKIVQPKLQTKIFMDNEDEKITLRIEHHYGSRVIDPFTDEETADDDKILLRDVEKEQKIMTMIEQSPLKYNGKQLYLEDDEEALYEFIFTILPQLEEEAEVYIAGGIKSYFQTSRYTPVTSVDMDTSGNFLEVNFDMDGIDEEEIRNVLRSVIEKKRYYRLPDGAFVSLESDAFEHIGQLLNELHVSKKELEDNRLKVPVYRGLQVEELMKTRDKYAVKFGKAFRKLVQQLKNPEDTDFELPKGLQAKMRDYQVTGFQWFKSLAFYRLGGILADDMGLGKTLQSISYMLSEKEANPDIKPFLVVAPASLIYNWKSEIEKFAPGLSSVVIAGTPSERKAFFEAGELPDVLITSYPTLRQDIGEYEKMEFNTLILDEAQAIKNYATKTAAAVRNVQAGRRFALSGTPIENSIDELWSIFQAVLPGFFPPLSEFRKMEQEKISRMVRPFILRRVKKDVLKELPDKIETNQLSELTKPQKELYLAYLDRIRHETAQTLAEGDFNRNRIKILAGLTRLRQLCCHPALFVENYQGESGKLEQLVELAHTAIENGKRLLIFSQFSSMLQLIRTRLSDEGIDSFYLDGQTPSRERVEMADRFNSGEKNVFLISLKAGGTGLNLTGADTVVLYDLWWNPAVEEQAAGRAHRIGQKNVVQVIRLISRGTIEEKIYELQQKKKELIEKVIQPGETMLNSLNEEEIKELLGM